MIEFKLTNVREQNKKYPKTFHLFDEKYLLKLTPKDCIKVILVDERFWLQVDKIDFEKRLITATVSNNLINCGINVGDKMDLISFDEISDIAFHELQTNSNAIKQIQYDASQLEQNVKVVCSTCNRSTFVDYYEKFCK